MGGCLSKGVDTREAEDSAHDSGLPVGYSGPASGAAVRKSAQLASAGDSAERNRPVKSNNKESGPAGGAGAPAAGAAGLSKGHGAGGSGTDLSHTNTTLLHTNTSGLDASSSVHAVPPGPTATGGPTHRTSSGLDSTGPGGGGAAARTSAGTASSGNAGASNSKRAALPVSTTSLRCSFAAEAAPVGAFYRRDTGGSSQLGSQRKAAVSVPRGSNSTSSGGPSSTSHGPSAGSACGGGATSHAAQLQAAGKLGVGEEADEAIARAVHFATTQDPLPDFDLEVALRAVPPDQAAAAAAAYPVLGVLAPGLPAPLEVLQRLWQIESADIAGTVARTLAAIGVLRLANLDDGSPWALADPQHVAHAAAMWPEAVAAAHVALLDSYSRSGMLTLEAVPDDGYILQALSHHLLGAGRLAHLRALLMSPRWLEAKLYSYGAGATVQDFRRYLVHVAVDVEATGDAELAATSASRQIKLLLQAFQLSLGAVRQRPRARMLRTQMLARLVGVAGPRQAGDSDGQIASVGVSAVNNTVPAAAVLAGGPGAGAGTNAACHQEEYDPYDEDEDVSGLRDWYEFQVAQCAVESIITTGGRRARHLLPRSASLAQAGALQRLVLRGHSAPLRRVAISPAGTELLTLSDDGSAQLWDLNVGDCVLRLELGQRLAAGCFTPNGRAVAVGAADGTAVVWNLAAAVAPGGAPAAAAAAAVGGAKGSTRVLKGHTGSINALVIDKQGLRLLTASADKTARVWDMACTLPGGGASCEVVFVGHEGALLDAAFSADGTLAATASEDFTVRVWDMDEDGDGSDDDSDSAAGGRAAALQEGKDDEETWLMWQAGGVQTKPRSPSEARRQKALRVLEGHSGWVTSVAFIGTTSRLVSASHDATARIWDADKGRQLFVLFGHTARLNRVAVDAGGSWAVTASDDNRARVWDCETGQLVSELAGHDSHVDDAAITRDGRKVVTTTTDGSCAVWDLASGGLEALLEGHVGAVSGGVVLSQRGRFAVTGGADGTARVWDLAAAGTAARPPPTHAGGKVTSLTALRPMTGADGATVVLVVSTGEDGRIILWDPLEGTCVKALHGHNSAVLFVGAAEDGERMLTGSGDRKVCHWHWSDYTRAAAAVGRRASLMRRELLMRSMLATMTNAGGGGGNIMRTSGGMTPTGLRGACGGGGDSCNLSLALLHTGGMSTGDGMDAASGGTGHGGHMSTQDIDDDPLADILTGDGAGAGKPRSFTRAGSGGGAAAVGTPPPRPRAPVIPTGRAGGTSAVGGGLGGAAAPGSRAQSRQALSHHSPGGGGAAATTSIAQRQLLLSTLPSGAASLNAAATAAAAAAAAAGGGGPTSNEPNGSAGAQDGAASSGGHMGDQTAAAAAAAAAAIAIANASTASTATTFKSIREIAADPARQSGILAQPGSRVKAMAFDGGCRLAAVLLYDSSVAIWDVETGRTVSQLIRRGERDKHTGGVTGVYLSRDGATCVTISRDRTARVWDVKTGATRFVVSGHPDSLVAADISSSTALPPAAAAVASPASAPGAINSPAAVAIAAAAAIAAGKDATAAAAAAASPPLLATASYDGTVQVTNLATGAAMAVLAHPQPPTAVAFSPGGGNYMAVAMEDGNVVVWDLAGRRCLPQLVAHRGHPLSVLAWSPDSGLLLTGAADCLLRVWRVMLPPQQQHSTRSVTGTAASAAAVGGASGGLAPPPTALVELGGGAAATEGEEVGFFVADAAITSACFAGSTVAVGDASGAVHFLDLTGEI
ncbi:hypothetical protein HYH02_012182 [Chlamydomonas schloesseri]|uniref:Uncharacterized protein n=1 Tax=Chlamydomonas schloesseri TaxID=2026947 RepID=A0A835W0A5_9CHLO|nr:hypothetical protein HYH02_012182 [Chlamydomonas schloesseri]|eukprot:KAG2434515.1 hypothetical protein HYH02_012182 [Chlamydomonas schloesseri]